MSGLKPIAVDVFAGGGGLSLGVRRAGFDLRAAIEVEQNSAATYAKSFPGVPILEKDVRRVTGDELLGAARTDKIDLLMGCAPCQGFCSLTSKHRREDPRNDLVLDMARLIEETLPDTVMMENVPGLAKRGRALFDEFLRRLRAAGYYPQWEVVQMADFGVPQNRRRLVLLAGRGFAISLPKPTHARAPRPGSRLRPWRTLRDAIGGEKAPPTLSRSWRSGGPRVLNWHVVRDLQPQTKARLRAARPGRPGMDLDDSLRPDCHRGGYEGFQNVYGRMTWDQLPVAITAGCTTPAKGRFGHPDRRRSTISVREAATLQTFPKSFRFVTNGIDATCEIIGNAVPPLFAEHMGCQVLRVMMSHREALAGKR